MWCPPKIALKWGSYFAPDTDDDTKLVQAAIQAHDAGLITKRAAVEKIKRPFNIENVDQFVEALEEEAADNMKRQQEQMAQAAALAPAAPAAEEQKPVAKKQPPKDQP